MNLRKLVMVLMALLMVSSLAVAYDEFAGDTAPPGRMGNSGSILANKTLSVGAYIAYHLSETIEYNGVEIDSYETDETFFGISAKFFPLMNGKLGATIDATLLSTDEYTSGSASTWMIDFGVAYRTMITKKLMAIGGIGYSQYYLSYVDDYDAADDESYWGDAGWYVKAGVEYFLSNNITVGGSFKWTTFEYEDSSFDTIGFKYMNFELSINYYL